ncbi:MAG TPA: hypothetical protein VGF56_05830 [Rhizomicrobium sp.]|jgi:hypothetical protein
MATVVPLNAVSPTEIERLRFEAWVTRALRREEAIALLTRSRGGDYVLATARAGWAAWQARGLCDAADREGR